MAEERRIILMGNAGSGKTTMAKSILKGKMISCLSLDEIAWEEGPKRKDYDKSVIDLMAFINANPEWIIEGCYSDLIYEALAHCTELRFLNPGVSVCVEHCKRRPWEPTKFATKEEQDQNLKNLIEWVQEYETRDDEYGLKKHREIFERFRGTKREYKSVSEYSP